MNTTGKKFGGRKKGKQNVSTREIKELIRSTVDFERLIRKLAELCEKGSIPASRILFDYGYGKPNQIEGSSSSDDVDEVNVYIIKTPEDLKKHEARQKLDGQRN